MTDASEARAIETAKKHNEGQEKLRLDLQTQADGRRDRLDRWPSWLVPANSRLR